VAGPGVGLLYPLGAIFLGYFLLLKPARVVYESPGHREAASLFNRASYMPISFLLLTVISILVNQWMLNF
jgi:hypothetical protein